MTIDQYIQQIGKRLALGNATEHTFRGDLQQLLETILPTISATNEPKRIACGAPDYILMQKKIPIGYIEAKDIGDKDLYGRKENQKQFDRYKHNLDNLIFTDYLRFLFYKKGEFVTEISLAELSNGKIVPKTENFAAFTRLIVGFSQNVTQSIVSPIHLAEMMANKAKALADYITKALESEIENAETSMLKGQMNAFRDVLMHDLTIENFADVYAQTIAYGMFVARYHDSTLEDFSREEATRLIPKSNPFLRKLFKDIEGNDLDPRIDWVIDDLVSIFLASDVKRIMTNYGQETQQEDAVIHFYETFLAAYDPKLRKARGVWYTPAPVVNFIVRAVDEILKTDFGLAAGLADTTKLWVKTPTTAVRKVVGEDTHNGRTAENVLPRSVSSPSVEVHRVQILDPATGTGTFLAEVIKHIYKRFEKQKGIWSSYVEKELIPRLNGFELLMASYAMAHLKLDLLLTETGFVPTSNQRFKIYLTNSLEEHHPDTGTLWAQALANEANEANAIKRDVPVMCVIGNPPYSGESANKGDWIMRLMEDYKKEPGGKEKLKERNPKWINDDYVKFIRFGQHFIEKNGTGILAFINPHGFLDNPTFRGMRWNLLKTYDKIYTLDLHGNSKKKEVSPDGSADMNVFDIMQGVSINIFIKTGKKKADELGKVFHADVYGKREVKYNFLNENSLKTIPYKEIPNIAPNYFFVAKDFDEKAIYEEGFAINELFIINGTGIVSKRDALAFQDTKESIIEKVKDIYKSSCEEIKGKYNYISWESRDGKVEFCKDNVMKFGIKDELFVKCSYRPFDTKWTYYTGVSKGFIGWPVKQVMQHFIKGENIGLVAARQCVGDWQYIFCTKLINEFNLTGTAGRFGSGNTFPLYLYPESTQQQSLLAEDNTQVRKPNLDAAIIEKLGAAIGLPFVSEKAGVAGFEGFKPSKGLKPLKDLKPLNSYESSSFAPIDVLDYIYAVLHSPTYREKYKEFLKIDFPRVPYPKDAATFWQLGAVGSKLRALHLLESEAVSDYNTDYPINGDNKVGKIRFERGVVGEDISTMLNDRTHKGSIGKVYINDTQYFDNVPQVAWEFYIGGYQPAQKWLKDRKDRVLSYEDIEHYQQIIVALTETDRCMQEIDALM